MATGQSQKPSMRKHEFSFHLISSSPFGVFLSVCVCVCVCVCVLDCVGTCTVVPKIDSLRGFKGLQASTLHPGKVSAIALEDFHRLVNEPRTLMIVAAFNTPVG